MPVLTASSLGEEKFDLAAAHRRQTIACADLAHHVVDVVFYCLLRDFQLAAISLFVRPSRNSITSCCSLRLSPSSAQVMEDTAPGGMYSVPQGGLADIT